MTEQAAGGAAAAQELNPGAAAGADTGAAGAQGAAGAAAAGAAGAADNGAAAGAAGAAGAAAANKTPAAADWPTDWREKYAGDDKAKLNTLGRYATPKDALDAMFSARGELQKVLSTLPPGKDATPEQIKAYRTAQGVPEQAEGYFDALPKGIVFGEADKPVVMSYLNKAHERGDSPQSVAENLAIYHQAQTAAVAEMQKNDNLAKEAFENQMRQELGGEYQANMTKLQNLLDSAFPKELSQALMNARLGDDKATPLMLNPGFVKGMINLARELNPTNTNTPGVGMDKIDNINDKIKLYESGDGKTVPRIGSKAWFKDEKAQDDYRMLIDARDRYGKK